MKGKAGGWILFLACLFLLSFAASTRYSKTADLALISFRLTILLILSVVVVRERWKYSRESGGGDVHRKTEIAGIMQRLRRWFYDEQERRG